MAISSSFLTYKSDSDDLDYRYSKSSEDISSSNDDDSDDDDSDDDSNDDDSDADDSNSNDSNDDSVTGNDDSPGSDDNSSSYSGFSVVEKESEADSITNFNASKDKIKIPFSFDNDIDFKFTDSRREFREALSSRCEIIFNDKTDGLYFNDNGQRNGLGDDGGLFAFIDKFTGRLSDDNFIG